MKADKEKIVLEMLAELENGAKYSQVLALNGTKWHLSKRTFVRYWNEVNERYSNRQNTANQKSNEAYVEAKVRAVVEGAVMSQIERQEKLSEIAKMPIEILANLPFVLKAVSELNRMDLVFGAKAPEGDIELIMPKIPVIE